MKDKIEPKTERVSSAAEQTNDEMAAPLSSDVTTTSVSDGTIATDRDQPVTATANGDQPVMATTNGQQTSSADGGDQQRSTDEVQDGSPALRSNGERSLDSHDSTAPLNGSMLNTEIVIHGSPKKEVSHSTTANTIVGSIDSEEKMKPPIELNEDKFNQNLNPEFDLIFCIAAVQRTTPNTSKLLAISKIDSNIKVDTKSDISSLNGYAADRSGSSFNSTNLGHLEEQFLVPKVPRDVRESFMSLSSSGSSTGVIAAQQPSQQIIYRKSNVFELQHSGSTKSNNILLSKNVYTYPESLFCYKCNHVYNGISENFSFDNKDFHSQPQQKTCVENSKPRKRSKQSNSSSSNKSIKKPKQSPENTIIEGTDVKEEHQNEDEVIDPDESKIIDPISFEIGDKVLALWVSDKLFYAATIIDKVPPKFQVEFMADFVKKTLNADALVHSSALKEGSCIAILDNISQEYRVGDIVSINKIPFGDETYTIDLENEVVIVPFEKLVLNMENARMLQHKSVIKSYHRLSTSNISEGKRIRLSRSTNPKCAKNNGTNNKNETSKRKKGGNDLPSSKRKRKCLFPEEPDPRLIPSTSTGITIEEGYDIPPYSSDSEFDQIREDLTTVNMNDLKCTDVDTEYSSPEKISENEFSNSKPIKVFKDIHIVVSYSKYKRLPMCIDSDLGSDHELTKKELAIKSEYFKPGSKPFKKRLDILIRKYGGLVHRYVNLIPRTSYKSAYIITDTPSQTCNFLLGLCLGIPAYHHKYVDQAIMEQIPFGQFLDTHNIKPIPNGYSVEQNNIVFRSPKTDYQNMFSGYIIYLALAKEEQNDFFASLLRFCGAIVYTSWKNKVSLPVTRHETIIITDEYYPKKLSHEDVPKLTLLWLIQSLICESPRPFDAHDSYTAEEAVTED